MPGALLPTSWWNFGPYGPWVHRDTLYKKFGSENFSVVPFLVGAPALYTSNLEVVRQVIGTEHRPGHPFQKSPLVNRPLGKWGQNIVAALGGETWKKHRRVVGPAFNNKLYEKVWDESIATYRQMEDAEGWGQGTDPDAKRVVDLPSVQEISTKDMYSHNVRSQIALLVIARCGFGFSFDWNAPPVGSNGEMSVQEALRVLADSFVVGLIAPNWHLAPGVYQRSFDIEDLTIVLNSFSRLREAFASFSGFMTREIMQRTTEVRAAGDAEDRVDAFTMLVKANEQMKGGGKLKLDSQEVIGNVFMMLFAGHETTAHTLSATLSLLALHQDAQDEISQQIAEVVGYERDPKFEDYDKLDKVLNAFLESLRMFPAAHVVIRDTIEDTVLQLPSPVGQEEPSSMALPIHKGTSIVIDMIGLRTFALPLITLPFGETESQLAHTEYNPRYFPNPTSFKPSRWAGVNPNPGSGDGAPASDPEPEPENAFTAFGIGSRSCLGRKFATTEAVAVLTMLLRDWRVEPALLVGETKEGWRERVLGSPVLGLTLGVRQADVSN
ncbi:hypothetical protein DXG03_003687 [Asterophora parasitica]|uniref:Cytochrome P450 n=1 Tax=Asterophora parasitica TaxID=117018 RepID=A0A9P7KEG7_9AGAR|nr:hypothetical protein DXG03_003687 [Asterophora parasitica]